MNAVIVTGDRHAKWDDWRHVVQRAIDIRSDQTRLVVIHGGATGIDLIAHSIAGDSFLASSVEVPAQWKLHGKSAGPKRNAAMLDILMVLRRHGYDCEVCAFHDDITGSKGTKGMVNMALGASVGVWLYTTTGEPRRLQRQVA